MRLWETALFPKNGVIKFSQTFRAIISSFTLDVGIESSRKNNKEDRYTKNILYKPKVPCVENIF